MSKQMSSQQGRSTNGLFIQTIGAILTLIIGIVIWAICGYIISLIPLIGPVAAISLFALEIALGIFLLLNWIYSAVVAIQGGRRAIPISNRLVVRFFR